MTKNCPLRLEKLLKLLSKNCLLCREKLFIFKLNCQYSVKN